MVQGQKTFSGAAPIYALDSTDVRALVEEFLIERKSDHECSETTLGFYRDALGMFLRWLEHSGSPMEVEQIAPAHIRSFRLFLQQPERLPNPYRPTKPQKPLSDARRAAYDRVLRTFFKWLHETAEYIPTNPLAKLPKPKVRRKPMRFLTQAELTAIWKSFESGTRRGERDKTIYLLLVDTGVRASELLSIDVRRANLATRTFEILGKGGHIRNVGMSDETAAQISRYVKKFRQRCDIPQLLLHATKVKPLTYDGLVRVLMRWQRQSGIEVPFSAHSFRRTYATMTIQEGADGLVVAAQLGHTTLGMTKLYVQEAGLDLAKLQANHSPLKRLKL